MREDKIREHENFKTGKFLSFALNIHLWLHELQQQIYKIFRTGVLKIFALHKSHQNRENFVDWIFFPECGSLGFSKVLALINYQVP